VQLVRNAKRRTAIALAVGVIVAVSAAACAGPTNVTVEQGEGPYTVTLNMDPSTLNPPQLATLNYTIGERATGKPVAAYTPVYGALLHNVLISKDLLHFQHSFTGRVSQGSFSVLTNFLVTGEYYNESVFQPQGAEVQFVRTEISTGSAEMRPSLVADPEIPKVSQGVQNNLLLGPNPVRAGQPAQLALYITEKGDPVTELGTILGGPGLMFVISEDGEHFAIEQGASPGRAAPAASRGTPGTVTTPAAGTATTVPTRPATGSTPGAEQGQSGQQQAAGQIMPSPTLIPDVANALATVEAQPVATLAPVQKTAMSSVIETPAVLPSVSYGPYVAFTHTFPKPGLYKVWFKTSYRQRDMVVDFVVRVQP
jgi:hypothetical protein